MFLFKKNMLDTTKERKKIENQRLIGKTVFWLEQKDEWTGIVESVIDYENIMVKEPGGTFRQVNLFDITRTI